MGPILQGAIRLLEAHPAVETVTVSEPRGGGAEVRAVFRVNLPSRWAAQGQSPTGVRALEEVLVQFGVDFPTSAPRFTLRADFPTGLPHIYPHKKGERVPPCITFGDKRDVLHSDGMYRLADQMSNWLDKAALDTLTNNEQGWEPSRRDVGFNLLQVDPIALIPKKRPFGGWRMFSCFGCWTENGRFSVASGPRPESPVEKLVWLQDILKTIRVNDGLRTGRVPLVFLWPQAGEDGLPQVHEKYKADTVSTFAELAHQASDWGCRVALDDFLSNINPVFADRGHVGKIMLFLVFPVRRPLHIIGTQSDFEMIAYRMSVDLPSKLSVTDTTPVTPVSFHSPVSATLLRRTSALEKPSHDVHLVFAGCGSLGSKLAMHTARAGIRPALLIDERFLVAHNVARHALLPEDVASLQGKAARLAKIIGEFGCDAPQVYERDIRGLDFDSAKFRKNFSDERSVVVNTTGSPAVRHYLTTAPFSARVLEGALVNHGAGAIMTLEGPARNPNSQDLAYHCYERLREVGLLREAPHAEESVLEIGVGCHSVTMPMSDARVSLVAAGIGQKLLEYDQSGLPESGVAAAATVGSDGMSISWSADDLGPTYFARVHDGGHWKVRVLDPAHKQIVADVARYPEVESGGLIVGSVSALTREIFVTGLLPAPPDSIRSATRFVLGVEGRAQMIEAYETSGARTLWCLGTWHSHLAVSGPSQMDRDTAALLDGQLRHAAVLLIRHPDGYAALVREGFSS